VVEADDLAGLADDVAPAQRHRGLDADPCSHGGREHLLLVGPGLLLEPLAARHGDHTSGNALPLQGFPCLHGERDLGPGPDQDHVWCAVRGLDEHVGSLGDAGGLRELLAVEDGQRLPGQRQR
jgi:hypothetical protein